MNQPSLYQKVIQDIVSKSKVSEYLEPFSDAFHKVYENDFPENYAVVFCLQTFEELFLASGLPAFRFCSGDWDIGNHVAGRLPVLCCPVVRSSIGFIDTRKEIFESAKLVLVPTTCDWKVKMCDYLSDFTHLHRIELPHSHQEEKNQRRWFAEVKSLVKKLEKIRAKKISAHDILEAIKQVHHAQTTSDALQNLRQTEKISHLDFFLVTGAYFMMDGAKWSKAAQKLISSVDKNVSDEKSKARIFLMGAPAIFPNFKLPILLDEFHATIVGDELCSSSRQFWDISVVNEKNKDNLLWAIANRYYLSCVCPSFSPNKDRMNRSYQKVKETRAQGVIYHVLKGCHLYDFERFKAESFFRENKIPFLHLETDDGWEDIQSLGTRIEAFVESIKGRNMR
jgi:benzoyl-CoA reductase/2-hydroxyglutaryl-CoA dehydratase subunit BcrC/BadD/HgdB